MAWGPPRLANHRAMALALKFEGSPLMGLTYSDRDKFLDAAPIPPARPAAADVAGGSPICNAPPLAATLGLDSGMTAPIIRAMSASRELQRQLKRLELCLHRPAKQPPTGPGWIHKIKHDGFRILAEREATGVRPTRAALERRGRNPPAFDPLEIDGSPIEERKAVLARLLRRRHDGIVFNEHYGGERPGVLPLNCSIGNWLCTGAHGSTAFWNTLLECRSLPKRQSGRCGMLTGNIHQVLDRIEAQRAQRDAAITGPSSALAFLQAVYRDTEVPLPTRIRCAVECLPFESPKLSATAVLHPGDFALTLERATARSGVKMPRTN